MHVMASTASGEATLAGRDCYPTAQVDPERLGGVSQLLDDDQAVPGPRALALVMAVAGARLLPDMAWHAGGP